MPFDDAGDDVGVRIFDRVDKDREGGMGGILAHVGIQPA